MENSWFIEHLGLMVVISAVLLVLVLAAWAYSYSRRRMQMLQHSEHELYPDSDHYFDDPLSNDYHDTERADPFFDTQELAFAEDNAFVSAAQPVTALPADVADEEARSTDTAPKEAAAELIIALFVLSSPEQPFQGLDLFAVFEELGMRYGRMKIYHHYGLGELKVDEPIFSVANLVEPGTFDPTADDFQTVGVAMFMRLPGPFGGRVALELLLNNAQKLAELLEGTVVDERRQPLAQPTIEQLRNKIIQFEAAQAA